jgi:hypothetical protein
LTAELNKLRLKWFHKKQAFKAERTSLLSELGRKSGLCQALQSQLDSQQQKHAMFEQEVRDWEA